MKTVETASHAPTALVDTVESANRSDALAAESSHDRTSSMGWQRSSKFWTEHWRKLAIVYVRQSSAQQVVENRESTARQYALADFAKELGWPASQVMVIDEDQGRSGASAEHRTGFQRLLAEITLDHVGLVLGLEMSRLARSNKDWHHLLELCAIFGTLLADQDGVYDPSDPNDRLLLGLKGTMSEVELHTMRNRLDRGRLNKAKRGELFQSVPMGYVRHPNGEVVFDPDQQAQSVMKHLFATFEQVGSIYGLFRELIQHDIRLPVRLNGGPRRGELDWRRPSLGTLCQVLHHPIYAGAYAYGRRPTDVRAGYASGKKKSSWKPMSEWTVLLLDRLPAYISWDQYLRHQERLRENRRGHNWKGTPGRGTALLTGLIVCGSCGRRLQVNYGGRDDNIAYYNCHKHLVAGTEPNCCGMKAAPADELVATQVLRALAPAAVELSLQAVADIEHERSRLETHWQQKLQRARYDVELAERRYRAVDPGNRLVAASLEQQWEAALRADRELQVEYDRFQHSSPTTLSGADCLRIRELTEQIPQLWSSPQTTHADRKAMVRCLVDQVVVHLSTESEFVDATIHWKGGFTSQHEFARPVSTYARQRDFESLMSRVDELREQGQTASEIAATLNAEGFKPPKRRGEFSSPVVYQLLKRRGLMGNERSHEELRHAGEWWLADLARQLGMSHQKLRDWAHKGWVHSRRTPIKKCFLLWADGEEVERLTRLLASSQRGINAYETSLVTPKPRPSN